ncbi:uncharacterized protein [Nicotiana sylvestris]|uniref:uncharacterized protein n=1 Tax=Nicotiana sylvestris TaxID=4096 RepID=UPI00388CEC88
MTNSENSVEEERTESQMLKEAMEKMRLEMNEMQLALSRVQKGPEPPVTPTFPPGHTPEYPSLGPSTSFPSHHYYQGRNPYDPQAPPPKQNLPPPNVPVFVAPPPTTLQRSSSGPLFQAHDNQYYPPEPTLKAPEQYTYNPHFEILVETEKPAKGPEQDEVLRKFKSLEQHDTEKCWKLKRAGKDLIDTNKIEVQTPEAPNINQNSLPAHHETHMIELMHKGGELKKPSQMVMMIRVSPKEKSTGGEEVVQLEKVDVKPVVVMGKSSPIVAKNPELVKVMVRGVPSKPACIGPVVIRSVMQMPITSEKVVPWSYSKAMVMYKGKEVVEEVCEAQSLTRSGRCFAPVELRRSNPVVVNKPVTEEEAKEFLKKMKAQDYSIVEQLRKTPAQISLLSLLIHSSDHCQAQMKIMNEAHVPDKISVNHLERIVHKIFEVNRVTFSDDELPAEGIEHNKALYLTVKCEDSVVT